MLTEEKEKDTALPKAAEESKAETEETIPQNSANDTVIPVKFNKETRNLNVDEAIVLAQKGLKFESIEKEYNVLKELAAKENKSVPVYLETLARAQLDEKRKVLTEKCGGDSELAEHIISLENGAFCDGGFEEVKKNFPEIKSPDHLPASVLENAQSKGTLLLDEYLRYLLKEKQKARSVLQSQKAGKSATTGSLSNRLGGNTPETEEFLKGLWK